MSGTGQRQLTAPNVPNNLPAELSTFVGRRADVDRGARLLADSRVVTFTGAGGCGKTRLAQRVAAQVADRFPDGVCWVELASLTDGGQVADRVARALSMQVPAEVPVADAVVAYVADRPVLFLLDNCEHIAAGVAAFATTLLRGGPRVRVLCTSRHPVGVTGESVWQVPSMDVPPPGAESARVDRFDAARLFLLRAGQARPDLVLDADQLQSVAQLCRRLDGIPLALELAAARVGGLAIERLVGELDDRFRLLTGGSPAALQRHRTLLASMDWSYELLDADERVLLRRLGVFAGGCTVEAAQAVAGFDPLAPADVLDVLARLVDKSLVRLDDSVPGSARYSLLETIRAYAMARSADAGETGTVADRHLAWVQRRMAELEPGLVRADTTSLDHAERDLPEIRAALEHAALAPPPGHGGLRLMVSSAFFWPQRGYAAEGADRALRVLAADPAAPRALLAAARWAGAYDRFYNFELDAAAAQAEVALEQARAAGDRAVECRCLHVLGAARFMVDPAASRPLFRASLALATATGDRWAEADCLQFLGFSELMQHRPGAAMQLLAGAGVIADEAGNRFQQAWQRIALGTADADVGELDRAAAYLAAGVELARRVGDPAIEIWGCACYALLELSRGRLDAVLGIAAGMDRADRPLGPAGAALIDALRRAGAQADVAPAAAGAALAEVGEILLASNDPPDGARLVLLGAAFALRAGDEGAARDGAERALAGCETLGSAMAGACRVLLARLDRLAAAGPAAERSAHAGLAELVDAGLWSEVPDALELLGGFAVDAGGFAEGARLLAAAAALHDRMGQRCWLADHVARDRDRAAAGLGTDYPRVHAEGAALDGPAAVAYARRARGARRRPAVGWASLTPTELEVVRLVVAGLTNPAIGERLFVSRGTVKTHLLHVFAKLEVHSRAELAAVAIRHGLG